MNATAYTKSLSIDNENEAYYGRGVLYYENGMIPETIFKIFKKLSKNGSLKAINYVNLLNK